MAARAHAHTFIILRQSISAPFIPLFVQTTPRIYVPSLDTSILPTRVIIILRYLPKLSFRVTAFSAECVCQHVSENQWVEPSEQKEKSLVAIIPHISAATHISRGVCFFSLGQNWRLTAPQSADPGWVASHERDTESAVVCIIGHVIILEWPLPLDSQSVGRSVGCSTLPLCGRPRQWPHISRHRKADCDFCDGSAIIY